MTKPLVSRRRRLRPRSTVLPLRARTMSIHSNEGQATCPPNLGFSAHYPNILGGHAPGGHDLLAQVALALAGFVAQKVFLAGLTPFQLAGGRDAKAFL